MQCVDCGKDAYTIYGEYGNAVLCCDCADKRLRAQLEGKSHGLQEASDFSKWKSEDMSELFWMHLAKYLSEPNERSLSIMRMAFLWACHANHGLSNSFYNALKWAKIDLYAEHRKWVENGGGDGAV